MKNQRYLPVIILFLLLLLTGCGGASAEPVLETAVPTPAATPTLPPPELEIVVNGTAVPTPTPSLPPGQLFSSPEYGVHLSQWWHVDDVLPRDLNLVQEMGFGWVKQVFAWRDIEAPTKGEYDWYRPDRIVQQANENGLKLLVRIDHQPLWSVLALEAEGKPITNNQPPANLQDFGDFCFALASRYQGQIQAYQVWNEPNLTREWGEQTPNPAEYTDLLRVCYLGIKSADPDAIVVSAGLAPTGGPMPQAMPDDEFLRGMYQAGAADYFDALGLNAPGYKAPPTLSPEDGLNEEWGGHRWNVFRHVEDMREIMVANGDADKQVVILETGWILQQELHPSYTWHGVTEQQQADYLVGAYQWARENWQPWIGPIFTIYMADATWTPEEHEQYWWSIVLPDGTPRPAYLALKALPK
ncbi:MAG: beta-galactosidase [Candidatus Promineifilaceae bacterium]